MRKIEKNTWRHHHFTQVYHKRQSYDIWFLKYEVQQTELFCHPGPSFCPFPSLTAWKIQISKKKKKKKSLEISPFYTSVPKFMIIGYTVPEILHVTDNFHFGLYFSLLASNSPKNEKFKIIKKTPGDIIILHRCTKNHDHMLYCL